MVLIVPGYIEVLDKGYEIILKSQLHGNVIKLDEEKYMNEFRKIQKDGTVIRGTELISFLQDQEILATVGLAFPNASEVSSQTQALK